MFRVCQRIALSCTENYMGCFRRCVNKFTNLSKFINLSKMFSVCQTIASSFTEHYMGCSRRWVNKFTNLTEDEPREKYEVRLSD